MKLPFDPRYNAQQALAVQPNKNVDHNDPESLRKVCRQFEEAFVQQMFKQMRATVPEGGLFDNGNDYQIYRDMMDAQIAQSVAQRGELGIGDMLYNQLSRSLEQVEDEASEEVVSEDD